MIVIAVLLLAAVAAVTAGVIAGAQDDAVLDIFGETINASAPEVFAVGAACGLAAAIAGWMMLIGTRRSTLRRREMRALRAERKREQAQLAREREELDAERERLHESSADEEAPRHRSLATALGRRRAGPPKEQHEDAVAERPNA